jgi:nifR3 family TIM-barrel protein
MAIMPTLKLGSMPIDPPVVLAPMAGITNKAFRRLCREQGAGVYVSEMVTAKAFVRADVNTRRLTSFDADEYPRSLQFYSVEPDSLRRAVATVVAEGMADHIDLNFGCPVRKVTRKGGGAAVPWKSDLFTALVTAAIDAADGAVPVTVKMRKGIDEDHLTYLEAGQTAARLGVAWVALHARTAQQYYGGTADWRAIGALKEHLAPYGTPVLGNGDIFTASDAAAMMESTGCDGVVIGRGCLGRPWLFGQLADAFAGQPVRPDPEVSEVINIYRRHAELLIAAYGEHTGTREIRKHHAWYFKGLSVPRQIRSGLGMVTSLEDVDQLLAEIDVNQALPAHVASGPRGRTSGARPVTLPQGWLDSRTMSKLDRTELLGAEVDHGGG